MRHSQMAMYLASMVTGEYYCENIANLMRASLKKIVDNASGLKTRNARIHAAAGAQHHDGQLAAGGAQTADELQPVHLRQHDVHDRGVERTVLRLQEAILAVGCARGAEARLPEAPGDELRDLRVVFDDEHVAVHQVGVEVLQNPHHIINGFFQKLK